MSGRLARVSAALLYQTTVALGIVLMPVALLARRAGVPVPLHRVLGAAERVQRRHARR